MPARPCPTCQRETPRRLPEFSERLITAVLYYRCDYCGHVWIVPKDAPDSAPQTVMPGIVAKTTTDRVT